MLLFKVSNVNKVMHSRHYKYVRLILISYKTFSVPRKDFCWGIRGLILSNSLGAILSKNRRNILNIKLYQTWFGSVLRFGKDITKMVLLITKIVSVLCRACIIFQNIMFPRYKWMGRSFAHLIRLTILARMKESVILTYRGRVAHICVSK